MEAAFEHVSLDWRRHVRVDESLKRGRAELHRLVGDASKARRLLGSRPTVGFSQLVELLVNSDVALLEAAAAAEHAPFPRSS